jgi:multidrug efflux pump subunit AcrB
LGGSILARRPIRSNATSTDGQLRVLPFIKWPDANSLQVGNGVKAKMEQLSRRFPQDLRYGIPYDTTIFVKASVNEVYTQSSAPSLPWPG